MSGAPLGLIGELIPKVRLKHAVHSGTFIISFEVRDSLNAATSLQTRLSIDTLGWTT